MAVTAKFVADFADFNRAVKQAEVTLKSFETGAANVGKSLNKMVDSLSGRKLIQDANLMTEAIKRIGGISALTERELTSMGNKAKEAAEKMRRLGIDVPPELQKLAASAKEAEVQTSSMGVSFGKLVASFISAQAIISAVKAAFSAFVALIAGSVKAASDAEKAHAQLGAALRAQGTAIPSVITAFRGYADELQRTTIFQDDAIEGAAALLVQIGNVMPRDMKKALDATTELASGLGIDLNNAAMMVAKAAEGNTTALKKLGVETTDVKGKALAFGEVLDSITDKFGGQAAAVAGTYQGRLIQLGNTWNDVQESIGRVIIQNQTLLDAFAFLNRQIAANTGELASNQLATNLVSDAVIIFVKGLSLGATAVGVFAEKLTSSIVDLLLFEKHLVSAATSALLLVRTFAFNQPLVQAFADLALRKVAERAKEIEGDLISAASATANAAGMFRGLSTSADALAADLEKTRGKTVALRDGTDAGSDAWDRHTVAMKTTKDAADKVAEAFERTKEKMREMVMWGSSVTKALTDMATVGVHSAGIIADSFQTDLQKMAAFTMPDLKAVKFDLGALFDMGKVTPPSMSDLKPLLTPFEQTVAKLPQLLVQAFTGGGGVKGAFKALGATIGSGLFGADGPFKNAVANAKPVLSSIFGKGIGGAFAAAIPGIGALIGPALSALWGGIKKIFGGPSAKELAGRDIKKQFQDSFGGFENMLGAITKAYQATGRSAEMARKDVERLMKAEKQGAEAVKAVMADINKAFEQQAAQWEATGDAISALNAFTADGASELGKYNIAADSAVAIFEAWVRKTGDVVGALNQIGPSLDAIAKGQKDLGLEGTAAINQLLNLRKVTEAHKPLMANIAQTTALFKAMQKAGLINSQNVVAFGQNAVNQFTLLKGVTGNATEAFVLMQPELQALWEHQQKFGKFADEATQALIDEAAASGVVGEEMKSDQEQILGVLREVRDALYTIAGIKIPDKTFNVTPNITPIEVPDVPDFPTRGPEFAPEFHKGGTILPFLPRAHKGLAIDERMIVGQTGEGIVSRAGMQTIGGTSGLNAINAGGGSAGVRQPIIVQVLLPDGKVLGELAIDDITKQVAGRKPKGRLLKQALGIKRAGAA